MAACESPDAQRREAAPWRAGISRLASDSVAGFWGLLALEVSRDVGRRPIAPILFTADGGGSNGVRVRLWKLELQKLADETGLTLDVCHYPPGTSKWNKIEHRLFCHISQNWRARPLTSLLAVVKLISSTTTTAGLKVACELDNNFYPKGIKVSDEEMEALAITGDEFHPEWNYSLEPRKRE